MPFELTSAFMLLIVASLCGLWLSRPGPTVVTATVVTPDAEEWRTAALEHFHQHRDLERSVAQALATPGAVSGRARVELLSAVGLTRVDTFA